MFDQIVNVLKNYTELKPEEIRPESLLVEDLGLNSVSYFSIVFDLEDTLGIEIPDEAATGVKTVGDLVRYLEEAK